MSKSHGHVCDGMMGFWAVFQRFMMRKVENACKCKIGNKNDKVALLETIQFF
jgi:hypothetical protein